MPAPGVFRLKKPAICQGNLVDSLQLTNLQLACSMTGAYFALNSRARGWGDEQVGGNRGAAKVANAAFDVGSRWSF